MDIAQLGITIDSRDVPTASRRLDQFAASGANAEKSTVRLARVAAGAFGALASIQTLTQAGRRAMEFGASMAEVSTLLDSQPGQMDQLERSARNLAKTYGTSATQQAKAYYAAISAGASDAAAASQLLDVANKLAVGGVSTVETAVDILTTALNAYGPSVLSAEQASDALFVGMRAGKTTITQLASSLGTVIPLSRAMGVSFDETVASVSALTTQGVSTSEAVTGVRAALTSISAPSREAEKLAKSLGLEFNSQALRAKGLAGFIEDAVAKTNGSSDAMRKLFSSTEATTAMLALAGGGSAKLSQILQDMESKAGATGDAFDKMAKDDMFRFNRAMSQILDKVISLGNLVLSIAVPALEVFANNLNTISGVAVALAGVFAARLAVSIGVNFVRAASAAVTQSIALEMALGATSRSAALAGGAIKSLRRGLILLRTALISTGIGALIVGAGYLIGKFLELVEVTGGWGSALSLVKDVAVEVFGRVDEAGRYLVAGLRSGWLSMKASFLENLQGMVVAFADFTTGVASGLNSLFGTNLSGLGSELSWDLFFAAKDARGAADAAASIRRQSWADLTAPLQSFEKLRDVVNATSDSISDQSMSAEELSQVLSSVADDASGAGSSLGEMAERTKDATAQTEQLSETQRGLKDAILDWASEGVNSFDRLAASIKRAAYEYLLFGDGKKENSVWGGLLGGIFGGSGLFAGLFDSGGHIPSGKFGIAGEYGPELVRGPAHVTSRVDTAKLMAGGASDGALDVRVFVDQDGNWAAEVDRRAAVVASKATEAGIGEYHRKMPRIVKQIQMDPHFRPA